MIIGNLESFLQGAFVFKPAGNQLVSHHREDEVHVEPRALHAGLASHVLVKVAAGDLAVPFVLALVEVARRLIIRHRAIREAIVTILFGDINVGINSLGIFHQGIRREVLQAEKLSVFVVRLPSRLVLLVGLRDVKVISLHLEGNHGLGVDSHNLEARVLVCVGGSGADPEVGRNRLLIDHVTDDLELLLVDVGCRLEANDMLILVEKSVVAEAELTSAFI